MVDFTEQVLTVVACGGYLLSQSHWLGEDICCQGEVIARQEGQREGILGVEDVAGSPIKHRCSSEN
ncbi:hypothetical protein E2C01_041672 [Portunus trituberculatus]|uniref:Uncharacterized protein n=1 Tax=Portunus trituberculatus TaxID=210409 RepID=A0A5B7FKI9_PORTR|nr:hypothetical protein [Portunus trituberculatus]